MNFSALKIYGTIPFQKDYKHTIDFESKSEQKNYFSTEFNKKGKSFSDFLYIDEYQKIIVEGAKGKFDGYNYLSFVNGDSNRTYYCFIDRFEYVSEDSTAIYFTVDVMQTYMFDYILKESYVERMHVDRWIKDISTGDMKVWPDLIYKQEDIIASEYEYKELWKNKNDNANKIGFLLMCFNTKTSAINKYSFGYDTYITPVLLNSSGKTLKINNNLMLPYGAISSMEKVNDLVYISFLTDIPFNYDINETNEQINIISSSLTEFDFVKIYNEYYVMKPKGEKKTISKNKDISPLINEFPIFNGNINDYGKSIRNEVKLYTPQFKKLYFTNFYDIKKEFDIIKNSLDNMNYLTITYHNNMQMLPLEYFEINYSENNNKVFLSGDNFVPFARDSFLTYMNNAGIKDIVNSTLSLVSTFATGNLFSISGLVGGIGNIVQSVYKSDEFISGGGNSLGYYIDGRTNFYLYVLTPHNINEIYHYLNKYGYLINEVINNIDTKSRYWFNFIKTNECNIISDMNNEIINSIKEIYNNGITFWHYNKGNYVWMNYDKNNVERIYAIT